MFQKHSATILVKPHLQTTSFMRKWTSKVQMRLYKSEGAVDWSQSVVPLPREFMSLLDLINEPIWKKKIKTLKREAGPVPDQNSKRLLVCDKKELHTYVFDNFWRCYVHLIFNENLNLSFPFRYCKLNSPLQLKTVEIGCNGGKSPLQISPVFWE